MVATVHSDVVKRVPSGNMLHGAALSLLLTPRCFLLGKKRSWSLPCLAFTLFPIMQPSPAGARCVSPTGPSMVAPTQSLGNAVAESPTDRRVVLGTPPQLPAFAVSV